ncbi:hypothetical protein K458DRAFT_353332 [Lentithecium fluviatile CBS 122367]|uniref:Uncharacterized protein n=1 Tax=Lentithecium fluviatile CBS 122367 TaxID=1168545 RepID=A0A6G1JLS8_9PLEO|nr:hypothetical protein K458DRAFT_353332 [Lentithecium fluviatile CBS 122367]
MADVGAELSCELGRIIASPYPPSLAKLADICASAEPLTIRQCIYHCPPCAITRLASIVSAALPLWQHTVVVLASLSHSPEFTHALLLHNPGLLDALLTKANSSEQAFEEYAQLGVTLLSRPLPESVSLPASAQSFFLRVFERATRNPHVGTLNPVYCMVNGTCRGLLSILPSESRQVFDAKLKHILSSSSTGQNSMLMLWCFGITILAEHPEAMEASPALKWETVSGRKLFGSEVNKTINLAYLNVIWAAKGDVGVSDTEALEGIRIATQTLRFIDQRLRERWPTSGDFARNMFTKLPSKILRRGINPAVQLEALSFYAMIAGKDNLPADLVREFETALPKVLSLMDSESLEESLSTSLPLFAPQMQEHSIRGLLSTVLEASVMPYSTHELSNMKVLVDKLAAMVPNCPQLRSYVLASLSSNDMQGAIQSFLQVDLESVEHGGAQYCRTYAAVVRRDLVSGTISLYLTSALSSGSPTPAFPEVLGVALIHKQQQLPFIAGKCSHPASSGILSPVSLFQQKCTPLSGVHLQDWRERLTAELENQGFYQRDSVIRSVAQICHDLESRCQTVEEPLRLEKEKSNRLKEEVSELRQKLASIELKRWEDGEHITALDSENERLEKEKDQISDQLERLRQDFKDANVKAGETLREAKDLHNTTKVQLRSIILGREDDIRAREQDIGELHSIVATRDEEIDTLREESRALVDKHNRLHAQLDDKCHLLELERETTSAQAGEISELKTESAKLANQLQITESELTSVTGQLDDLQRRHHELAQSSTEALENLERQFENEIDAAESKAAAEHSRLNSSLQDALRNGREAGEAYEALQRELEELQTTVPHLEAKIHELTDSCLEQEEELGELRAWKNRVMASMGLPPEPVHTRAVSWSINNTNDPRTPRQHRRRKSALQTQEISRKAPAATQVVSSTAMENVANASFTSSDSHPSQSGSTPKRPKPPPSFKAPSMHTPYSNKPLLVSKSVSKKLSPAKRSALRPISPNHRHTTVGFAIPENEVELEHSQNLSLSKRRGSLQNAEQAGFDMEEFVAGSPFTPGAFMSGTGRLPEDDGSTTEL